MLCKSQTFGICCKRILEKKNLTFENYMSWKIIGVEIL